jgi:hypothetical protein
MLLQKGTLLCRSSIPALSRGFRFSRQSLFSPDLYEGSRTDRRVRATLGQIRKVAMFCDPATRGETAPLMHVQPYPSPVSGLEKVFKGGDLLPVSAITLLIAAFIFLVPNITLGFQIKMKNLDSITTLENKIIPTAILNEAKIALSHYPELQDTPIEFKFKKKITKSFMQAQPKVSGILKKKKNRAYMVLISRNFQIENEEFDISEIPSEVLVGWIGHELGHIMDYRERSGLNLVFFGIRYLTSKKFLKEAERVADTYAVSHGLSENILATKDFILNHAHLSDIYKNRIRRHYLSPEEILLIVEDLKEIEKEEVKQGEVKTDTK